MIACDFTALDRVGLNLHAVLDPDMLAAPLVAKLRDAFGPEVLAPRVVLVGNAGPAMWAAIEAADIDSPDPIDDFTVHHVGRWLQSQCPGRDYRISYPGDTPLNLQALGDAAGWHYSSPFLVGVHPEHGSWFGYRAVVLIDAPLAPTVREEGASPCADCSARPCEAACPAGAITAQRFDLRACVAWRQLPESPCALTCHARVACPVGQGHRYAEAQMRHMYGHSLAAIRRFA